MPIEISTLTEIEVHAKTFSSARELLSTRVATLQEQLATVRNRLLPGIKSAVAAAKDAESVLEQAVSNSRHLFVDPRTITAHGIKVGIVKGKGKVEWTDVKRVVELIEKHFPAQKDVLVKTTKKPIKKALQALTVGDLKRIGCTTTAAGDVVVIKPVDDEVDKLVAALLDEGSVDDESEE
ncbi:hypothetical protein [Horticoccus sp. 23ND18S-11]|uniref:hypothetical protein n=1 Tax=Horticoccus sp. 23ND18S-11 TaxID=3391832 RepID=UPI0039C96B89